MNTKGKIFLICFRISSLLIRNIFFKTLGFPIRIFYKVIVQWFSGKDSEDSIIIGSVFDVFDDQSQIKKFKNLYEYKLVSSIFLTYLTSVSLQLNVIIYEDVLSHYSIY